MPLVPKVRKLPPAIKAWLEKAFIKHAFGDVQGITAELNALLKDADVGFTIGKSAVHRESVRVRQAQEAIAATTRSMQLIAESARDDADLRGEALNAALSTDMFTALLAASQAGTEADPTKRIALLTKASLAAARLSTTSVRQRQHRHTVEQRAKAAATEVEKIAKAGGLSHAQVREIRAQILGVAKPAAAAAAP